ncbi:L,D-transpeptidase-like protein [Anoxybacillus vitaminiphilus]|uniref:L,D-transpeptidase-like protein n=1 Tax=Paranoxybacillus vitaminiphilus TaxID=581036 RepID=A0A327YMG6_9BACL|nr:L,D-transpeptidase [Anoxybacillus vitaminiphilus]RAK22294.1 L,D-transpeptidase-like protein [Anoxybacillus vitaminiphilus]
MPILFATILAFASSPLWFFGANPLFGNPFIIINKSTNQLAFIDDGKIQVTYPVATGLTTELTPEGMFTVTVKAKQPYYRKKNIPGGAPNNPLGSRWIGFDANGTDGRTYGIHGTNNAQSIGMYITQGCVRLHNHQVEALFEQVPLGTKVLIVRSGQSFEEMAEQYGVIKR